MSLPTTRFALSHVGTARNQGPHLAACADPQVRGLFWRRQFGHRSVHTDDVPNLQRRDFPHFPRATAAPTNARTPNDRGARQCPLSSRETPGRLSSSPCPTVAPAFPAALQPATRSDRTSVEADSAPRNSQPLLRDASRRTEGRQRLLRSLAQAQQGAASTMLHYLRRCV
jgi:hypothetical protein